MTILRGYAEPGKWHSQEWFDAGGFCPRCLELQSTGRGGGQNQLEEEVVDGVKTGKWICPFGGKT